MCLFVRSGVQTCFAIMAFSQLTWRESLRDIEVCLEANQAKLFPHGHCGAARRSTLADALNCATGASTTRCLRLISHARVLYAEDPSCLGLDASVYALDSTHHRLMFELVRLGTVSIHQGGQLKLHTLLDLRGAIPAFIHISDGKLHDVNVLEFYLSKRGSFTSWTGDTWTSCGCTQCTGLSLLRHIAPTDMDARRVYSIRRRPAGIVCDQRVMLNRLLLAGNYRSSARIASRPERQTLSF